MIEKLMKMGEKQIYLIYTTTMFLVITFQLTFLLWNKDILSSLALGFNIGIWSGFSLYRLLRGRK